MPEIGIEPGFSGVDGMRVFQSGAWWSWAEGAWSELPIETSLAWKDLPIRGPEVDRLVQLGADALDASGGAPVSASYGDLPVLFVLAGDAPRLFSCEKGASTLGLPAPPARFVVDAHPRGMAGVKKSARKVAEKILEGIRDRRVFRRARKLVSLAYQRGEIKSPRGLPDPSELVGVFFRALRDGAVDDQGNVVQPPFPFVQDPWDTETVSGAPELLSVEGAEDIPAGDCANQLVVLASLSGSVGIGIRLRIRYYAGERQAHITMLYDSNARGGGPFLCFDPSLDTGACSNAPYEEQVEMDVCTTADYDRDGVFLGLGSPAGALGATSGGASGDGPPLTKEEAAAWTEAVATAGGSLALSAQKLQIQLDGYRAVRADLGFDPHDAPGDLTGRSLPAFLAQGTFTAQTEKDLETLIQSSTFLAQAITDAIAGKRSLYWNDGDVLVEAKPGDLTRVLLADNGQGTPVPTYFDPVSNQPSGQVGNPILIGVVVAVCTLASAYATIRVAEALADAAREWCRMKVITAQQGLVAAGKAPPDSVDKVVSGLNDYNAAQAKAKAAEQAKPPGPVAALVDTATTLLELAFAGLLIAGVGYAGYEIVKSRRSRMSGASEWIWHERRGDGTFKIPRSAPSKRR